MAAPLFSPWAPSPASGEPIPPCRIKPIGGSKMSFTISVSALRAFEAKGAGHRAGLFVSHQLDDLAAVGLRPTPGPRLGRPGADARTLAAYFRFYFDGTAGFLDGCGIIGRKHKKIPVAYEKEALADGRFAAVCHHLDATDRRRRAGHGVHLQRPAR